MTTPQLVLGIESSCDETAAAVVRDGREVLSSVVISQISIHAKYGGVVPEVAGRAHLDQILPVIDRALEDAGLELGDIQGLAATARPGLVGSLLVGFSTAKALAFQRGLPWVDVHHIEAHVYAALMEHEIELPVCALVVSGGHTALYRVEAFDRMQLLAKTLDDAAGEAFDKVAVLLGLPYPGGPSVSKLALEGDPERYAFPRYRAKPGRPSFSFSGLKTAVLYHLRGGDATQPTPPPEAIPDRADVAASFEAAAVASLVRPTLDAAEEQGLERVVAVGGVACNQRLRRELTAAGEARGLHVHFPSPAYCTDNAAMIAGLGYQLLRAGKRAELDADVSPRG
jgi:N6-L-threonylcarbamoyladenine synthase